MAMKTISMKNLQSLQAAGKIVLTKVDTNVMNYSHLQEKVDSVNVSQQNSHTNEQQIKEKTDKTIVSQESQDKFIWTKQATFALLSAYEARNIETDNTKKNKKFWQSIAVELNELSIFNVPLTGDQVRWKFSALKKSYNKKKDHNRTSGNAPKIFDDFEERLMDILGDKNSNFNKENSFNSPILEHNVSNQPEVQNATTDCELQNVNMEQEMNGNERNAERETVRKKKCMEQAQK